jgi:hypothetical protein
VNINISNKSFERVEQFKYFGTTLMDQNSIHEEMSRLKSGKACYLSFSAASFLSSSFLSKNVMNKIYRTIILPVGLCGYDTLSLTLTEHGLRFCKNRLLKRIFGSKKQKRKWKRLHKEELYALYSIPNVIWMIKSED